MQSVLEAVATPQEREEPAWLSRALRPITRVERGEAATALLLTLNVFLLLTAYYLVKPVREALILSLASGAEYKSYLSGAIAILLLFAVPAYAKIVDRLPRVLLVTSVTLFFAANLGLFFFLIRLPAIEAHMGLVFYAWVGVFNMMVVAQFWSYASDLYDPERGARLFPLLALGASLGAAVGSQIAALLIPLLGIPSMLGAAALVLCACAALFWLAERRQPLPRPGPTSPARAATAKRDSGAFGLVFSDRYLLWVAAFSLIFSWVNSNGEYSLGVLVQRDARAAVQQGITRDLGAWIGARYAQFFFYVNMAGVFVQTFAVARVVRWLGFRVCFLIFPLIALADASAIVCAPVLAVVTWGKTAENALDYSLNNTLRQMLWLVTARDVKYKAKQAVDTFIVRLGDLSSALSVWLGTTLLGLDMRRFAALNIVLCVLWLALSVAIGRAQARLQAAQVASNP